MIRIFGKFVSTYTKIEKMCVIEGIESVIDDGRSPHNLFLTRIYGLFIFKHV